MFEEYQREGETETERGPAGPSWVQKPSCVPHFFSFVFLDPRHKEVPRLGVQLELQLPATATATPDPNGICDLHPQLGATLEP